MVAVNTASVTAYWPKYAPVVTVAEYCSPDAVLALTVYSVLQFLTLTESTRPSGTVPVLVSPAPSVTVYS